MILSNDMFVVEYADCCNSTDSQTLLRYSVELSTHLSPKDMSSDLDVHAFLSESGCLEWTLIAGTRIFIFSVYKRAGNGYFLACAIFHVYFPHSIFSPGLFFTGALSPPSFLFI